MSINLSKIKDILVGEPAYRAQQAKRAVFIDLVDNWLAATNLPLKLREKLNVEQPLDIKAKLLESSEQNVAKALIYLADGLRVETVLLSHRDGRHTACVSSQVGCPLACVFCATGQLGFQRNLLAEEIITQVLFWARYLKEQSRRVANIVFMGMGEPLLNYDQVMTAIRTFNNADSFNIGARHISLSTVGIPLEIKRLATEKLPINLAISLHAPNDQLRSQLMPINQDYSLRAVLAAVEEYLLCTRRRVMFEYLMIEGVNDADVYARELVTLVRKIKPAFINLIAYNPSGKFQPSTPARIKSFKNILEHSGLEVTERYRFGRGIKAACGQLAGQ